VVTSELDHNEIERARRLGADRVVLPIGSS